jgi:anti-anti-sigma factor
MAERVAKRAKTGESVHGVEVELVDKDGKQIPVSYSATGIRSPKGKILGEIVLLSSERSLVRAEKAVLERDEAIRRLSTPLVEIAEGVILLPVVGVLDSARAKQLTELVLECIAQTKADVIVIDISGIVTIDTKSSSHILRTVQAVRLMGSEVVITGIRPDVAVTLVTLGVDLSGIITRSTLREGLEYAYEKLGLKLTRV